jgi:hypothetical protein
MRCHQRVWGSLTGHDLRGILPKGNLGAHARLLQLEFLSITFLDDQFETMNRYALHDSVPPPGLQRQN